VEHAVEPTLHTRVWDRVGAGSGLVFIVMTMFGNGLVGDDLFNTSSSVDVGIAVEFLGFVAMVVLVAYLYSVLRATDRSWLPVSALIGGVLALVSSSVQRRRRW